MAYKKGFTLVELLGVFVILSIIVLVTFPYATGLLKNTKDNIWECLTKPAKRIKVGTVVSFGEKLKAKCIEVKDEGIRILGL